MKKDLKPFYVSKKLALTQAFLILFSPHPIVFFLQVINHEIITWKIFLCTILIIAGSIVIIL